jgi:aryl-alcohol dehydrogenase-like predicted oxidoreductase
VSAALFEAQVCIGSLTVSSREGKVKAVGISEPSSDTLRRAHAITPIAAVQVEYNPWDLSIEGPSGTNLKQTCDELGVAIVAYAPLGRGIITGRYRSRNDFEPGDVRLTMERFQEENFAKNLVVVDKFREMAEKKGCTPSQLVLAWLTAQGDNVFVIPGTKNTKYLEENIGASKVILSREDEQELRKIVAKAEVKGSRSAMFGAFVDTVPLQ